MRHCIGVQTLSKVRSIMLLGGSTQQVVAIEKANELGYRTVLCDYLPDNPGQYAADVFRCVSTTNREAVLEVAREENVSGVLAYASDPAAPTASYVAERLGFPGIPLNVVETLSEKHLFREHLRKIGLPSPRSTSFDSNCDGREIAEALHDYRWPIVVKPTDSSGSKGVTLLKSLEGLDAAVSAARAFSRNGVLIAEEFVRSSYSNVVGGDIFVVDGEIRFWGLMDCLRDEKSGGMVPVGKMLPTALPEKFLLNVKEALSRLVYSLGIESGELNVEVIIGENGKPYVLELGARAGGNMIPVQLSDASGIDLVSAAVRCAMGRDPGVPEWDASSSGAACAHVVLHSSRSGRLHSVEYGQLEPFLCREVLYKSPGSHVSAFCDASDAIGIAFFRFGSTVEMRKALSKFVPFVRLRDGEE